MTRRPTNEETQEIYKIYCQLATIIHDYAVGQQLYKKNCYSWAITANYYSLMHCGRFICLLGLKDYPSQHKDLHKFLSGQEKFKSNLFNDLLNKLPQVMNNQETEKKIKVLGKKLELIKKLREDNSYEFFIISHQINHSVLGTEFPKAYEEIKRLNDEYLNFIFELFVAYINSLDYKDYFIGFLNDNNKDHIWAIKGLINDLKNQNIGNEIIVEVKKIIDENLMDKLGSGAILSDSFFGPIKYDSFTEKNTKMVGFIGHINALISQTTKPP